MLSYQHSYHAGCLADVLKHLTLTCLLTYMTRKDTPFFYLDTHAGRGRYDLSHPHALKTGEAQEGIVRLWEKRATLPDVFLPYLHAIEILNPEADVLRYYPGSPQLAIQYLRRMDRATFCERHPGEFEILRQLNKQGQRIFLSPQNGLTHLYADLPPKERRGLIFIDPAYELDEEYRQLPKHLEAVHQRFAQGMIGLWYPLLQHQKPYMQLLAGLAKFKNTLRIEMRLKASGRPGMQGSGLWILNPPFILASQLKPALSLLEREYHVTTSLSTT